MCRTVRLPALLVAACALLFGAPVMAEDQTGPSTNVSLTSAAPVLTGSLRINGTTFTDVRPVASRVGSLEAASNITDNNGIDEVYVKDANGRLYVAYGYYSAADGIAKTGFPGHINGQIVEVVHVNNEMNTYSEALSSGWDDIKGILKSLMNENFGKLMGTLGLGSAAVIGRQLLMHPKVTQSLLLAARAAVPVLGTSLAWAGGAAAIGAALWPTVIKPLIMLIKRLYLDRQKDNPNTIAMVTAETAAELDAPITIGERHEATPRENLNEVLRRTDLSSTAAPANPEIRTFTGTTATGTGSGTTTRVAAATGTGTGTATQGGNGTPVTSPGVPMLGTRPAANTGGDLYSDLRNAR